MKSIGAWRSSFSFSRWFRRPSTCPAAIPTTITPPSALALALALANATKGRPKILGVDPDRLALEPDADDADARLSLKICVPGKAF